jgi:hypothetical protein
MSQWHGWSEALDTEIRTRAEKVQKIGSVIQFSGLGWIVSLCDAPLGADVIELAKRQRTAKTRRRR